MKGYLFNAGQFEPVDEALPARLLQKQGVAEQPYSTGGVSHYGGSQIKDVEEFFQNF